MKKIKTEKNFFNNHNIKVFVASIAAVLMFLLLVLIGSPFARHSNYGKIVLPNEGLPQMKVDLGGYSINYDTMTNLNVFKDNVKEIILNLNRPLNYRLSANGTIYFSRGQYTFACEEIVRGNMSRSIYYNQNGDTVLNSIISDDKIYLWGDEYTGYYVGKKGSISFDKTIFIPTYEDIVTLDDVNIISAEYRQYNDCYCIYIEALDNLSGYRNIFYVSVESGLLVGSQSFEGEKLVYAVTCDILDSPASYEKFFTLPDGLILSPG